jgi:hypothetical protein
MVGTIEEIVPDNSSNFYILKVRTKANFNDLQQVQVVENLTYSDQNELLLETRKKIDEVKKTGR